MFLSSQSELLSVSSKPVGIVSGLTLVPVCVFFFCFSDECIAAILAPVPDLVFYLASFALSTVDKKGLSIFPELQVFRECFSNPSTGSCNIVAP